LPVAAIRARADDPAAARGEDRVENDEPRRTTMTTSRTAQSTPLDTVPVERIMHLGFVGCPFETPLVNVARLMAQHRVHAIVGFGDVTEGDTQLWGLVSDIDVVAALAAGGGATTAGEIAASEVVTIAADDPVRRAVELMNDHQIAHVLVVDPGSDRPLGVVSTLDIAALVGDVEAEAPHAGSHVAELMTTPAVTVAPDLPLKDVAALLVEHGISGVPVVDAGRVVGVVSEADVIAREPEGLHAGLLARLGHGAGADDAATVARTAGDAMTSPALTIAPWRSAAAAAALMTTHGVKRLPVVRDEELVGIVTRADLVRAFVRPDGEIRREIEEDVLRRAFWLEPGPVTVGVERGEVTLTGEIPIELEAGILARAVARVPGVVSVRTDLRPGSARPVRRVDAG